MRRIKLILFILGGFIAFIFIINLIGSCAGKDNLKQPVDLGSNASNNAITPTPPNPAPAADGLNTNSEESRSVKDGETVTFKLPVDKRQGYWTLSNSVDRRIQPEQIVQVNKMGEQQQPFTDSLIILKVTGQGTFKLDLNYRPEDYSANVWAKKTITFTVGNPDEATLAP
jgi:hypothetical protein